MNENIIDGNIKYQKFYQSNDLYWGLGIENETYLIQKEFALCSGNFIKKNRVRERYSVDYNLSYNTNKLTSYLNTNFPNNNIYKIPNYINSHTFSKTDPNGEHITLHIKKQKQNPKFEGKTIHQLLMEQDNFFCKDYDNNFVYDGDTIEFITQNFYKTTIKECINELVDYKQYFLSEINKMHNIHKLPFVEFPKVNYGLVQFKTNQSNVSIFNNGTYHINITLPTQLDDLKQIQDPELFEAKHKNAIKLLQWMEPFFIALYGSPDIFSFNSDRYCSGSLRLTASRYIGISTFDTKLMKKGKLLNDNKRDVDIYLNRRSWYNQIYDITDYSQDIKIGYDFNYCKHYNAGIEFRIWDYFPEEALEDLMNLIILLLDHSLKIDINELTNDCDEWHNFTKDVLLHGYTAQIPDKLINIFGEYLNFPIIGKTNIREYFGHLINFLFDRYHLNICSTLMSPNMIKPKLNNINRYMWENNYLQYIPINNKNDEKVLELFKIYKLNDMALDKNNKLHNLMKTIKIYLNDGLTLDSFYVNILIICDDKLNLCNYVLCN